MDTQNIFYDQALSQEALDFLENSKMTTWNNFDLGIRISTIMKTPYYANQIINSTTELGICKRIKLSSNFNEASELLHELQLKRKSTREFKRYIDLQDISNILLNSYFITECFKSHTHHLRRRSIPSGGALYPIDLYYINMNTTNLQLGIYYYNPLEKDLECIEEYKDQTSIMGLLKRVYPSEILGDWDLSMISGIIVFAGILNRTTCKYGDRGIRFAIMDVGAILQNIHLAAAAENISCCAIGGYLDHEIDSLLRLQNPNETVLLTLFIGRN